MTPERIEEIKELLDAADGPEWAHDSELMDKAPVIVRDLLAALEEAQKLDIKTINKIKKLEADLQSALVVNHKYLCDIERIGSELAEAQQTIARHIEAFDKIADEFCDDCNSRAERINEIIFPFLDLEEGETQP